MTNADFERIVDTSDEWITTRTGIKERRVAKDIATSDMAVAACKNALEMADCAPDEIGALLAATVTPDYRLPSVACVIQEKMALPNAVGFDIVAACTGFINSLSVARSFIESGHHKKVLVTGVEKLSLKSDGSYRHLLWSEIGGTVNPYVTGEDPAGRDKIMMNGSDLFKVAVREMGKAATRVVEEAGLTTSDVSLVVPHQANIRIIEAVVKRLGISMDKVFLNIHRYGNTSSASVPLALDEANRSGRIKPGDYVLMVAFGGGLIWGSALVRW
jgi:3-oxoacyl-[acyl-carrier-protein] synthase-3